MTRNNVYRSLLSVVILLAGCDSQRLKEFSSLAAAGSAYSATVPVVTYQHGTAHIAIDSDFAMTRRRGAGNKPNAAVATEELKKQDADLKEYLSTLDKINHHAALLGAYFDAIAQLASTKNSDAVVKSADGVLTQLGALSPQIKNAKIGGKAIDSFIDAGTKLAVAHFQVRALDQNLDKNAATIDEALALQEAAIKAIKQQLTLDMSSINKFTEQEKVINPYLTQGGELPQAWFADREAYIRSTVMLDNANASSAAIAKLRAAFRDVVANKGAQVDFKGLLDAIGQMVGFANAIRTQTDSAAVNR